MPETRTDRGNCKTLHRQPSWRGASNLKTSGRAIGLARARTAVTEVRCPSQAKRVQATHTQLSNKCRCEPRPRPPHCSSFSAARYPKSQPVGPFADLLPLCTKSCPFFKSYGPSAGAARALRSYPSSRSYGHSAGLAGTPQVPHGAQIASLHCALQGRHGIGIGSASCPRELPIWAIASFEVVAHPATDLARTAHPRDVMVYALSHGSG